MKTLMAGIFGASLLAATAGGVAMQGERTDPNRPDCPGQVRCPQNGEWVCRDQCPQQQEEEAAICPLCR